MVLWRIAPSARCPCGIDCQSLLNVSVTWLAAATRKQPDAADQQGREGSVDVDVEVHGSVCVGLEGRAVALHRFELLAASFLRCGLASNMGCAQGGTGQAVVEKPSLEACATVLDLESNCTLIDLPHAGSKPPRPPVQLLAPMQSWVFVN